MRMPNFHLRTLLIAVLIPGLIVGNYAFLTRQLGPPHSYGFPPSSGRLMLLTLARVLMDLLLVGFAYGAIRAGWRVSTHLKGRMDRRW